jgi:hypothetical protein
MTDMNRLVILKFVASTCICLIATIFVAGGAWAQGSTVRLTVIENDQSTETCDLTPPEGCLKVAVEVSTTGLDPNNFLSSGTIDVNFNPAHISFLAGFPGDVTPGAFPAYSISASAPGSVARVQIANDGQIGPGVFDKEGAQIGATYWNLQTLWFQILQGGINAGTTDLTFDQTFTTAGYFDDGENISGLNQVTQQPILAYLDATGIQLDPGLAVELTDFSATVRERDVVLAWATASESGITGFNVERATVTAETGKRTWQEVGFVQSSGGADAGESYTYRVSGVDFGNHVFRLKAVDESGSIEYSDEIEVAIDLVDDFAIDAPYPNPFRSRSTISFAVREAQDVSVELYNLLGQRVTTLFEGTVPGSETKSVTLDGASLPAGLYLIRFVGERFVDTRSVTHAR